MSAEGDVAHGVDAVRRHGYVERAFAVASGIVCHGVFAVAISAMIASLATGMTWGGGPWSGLPAVVANLLLVAQFPLVHSWLLTDRGGRVLARLAPLGLGRDLATTTFATIASLQLLLTFVLWSPSGVVWWRAEGAARVAWLAAYAASWVLLLRAMIDAGLDLQSGFRGWGAVARGRAPEWTPFPTHGLFRFTRQPVYVAFFLALWTAPVWTPDRLLLTLVWSAYCLVAPHNKERRLLRREPERYRDYQSGSPTGSPDRSTLRTERSQSGAGLE